MTSSSPHPSLRDSLRALPRPAWYLFLGAFINKFGGFVLPFLSLYLTSLHYTLGQAAFAGSAYGAGNLVAMPLGGYLADHFGRRQTILLSTFAGAAAMILLYVPDHLGPIVAMAALAGLTGELYRPASSAFLTDLVASSGDRVTAFSAYRLAFNAGWAFGPATAGLLAGHSFFWLFVGDAGTSLLFGLVALFRLPKTPRAPHGTVPWSDALRTIARDRAFLRLLCGALLEGVVFFQMLFTFSLAVTDWGYSPKVYGAVLSFNGALIVIAELPLTTLTRRFPPLRMVALGYALLGVGFGLFAVARSIPALFICSTILTLGEMVAMPVASAYIAGLAPPALRGRYMGMYGMTWAGAMILAPQLGLRLYAVSPNALWLGGAALALLGAAIIFTRPAGNPARIAPAASTPSPQT